jgi:hypothetical protein
MLKIWFTWHGMTRLSLTELSGHGLVWGWGSGAQILGALEHMYEDPPPQWPLYNRGETGICMGRMNGELRERASLCEGNA